MPSFPLIARCTVAAVLAAGTGCASQRGVTPGEAPPLAEFCLEAQQVIVHTAVRPALIVHTDFDAFVKSKALIDPLSIQQYVWYENDDTTRPVMVSCKMKSADHLNAAFGKGTSGGDGQCQDMNRLTWERVRARLGATAAGSLAFDGAEVVRNTENPGMTGPDWLKPYEMTWRDERGVLHLRSKGFRVDWTDPQFAAMPGRFRGVQYCHLITPEYLTRLVTGQAEAGLVVGREITDLSRAPPAAAPGHRDDR
ncbi:MAG: hypothetical protein OEW88_03920 [Gammaproteobacteria bacterium]|nr:hypothetical protein [Gammaproteobacteria bacterium]MDH5275550.1 hypothetical protein [Gammaproteobacteria bacterium]